jgi:AAHS family 4-hydroxybenzoate transporter-like MFS transporter
VAIIATDRDAKGLLDDLPMSSFQVWTVLMTAATVVLDGLDNQMLGLAAPSLLKEWGIGREALGLVFALGFVGMAIGTLTAGWFGDRFGRRGALLAGVAVFGLATLATGFSDALWQVAALKTLAGIGLGGVPGTASAMIAEFTPARWRSAAVTFGVVCVSIGGILGGVAAAAILPVLGWRWLFYLGGTVTIVFTVALWRLLPESPRFLEFQPHRRAEYDRLMHRMGATDAVRVAAEAPSVKSGPAPFSALFRGLLLRDSLALSLAMFSGMFMIYLMFNWAPTMLSASGFGLSSASLGLTSFNIGGTLGAVAASFAIMRFGSRPTLVLMAVVGAAACLFLAALDIGGGRNEPAVLAGLGALGLFASAAQSAMFAVGAHAFPTILRGRGLGLMGAAGRAGAIVSSVTGAALIGGGNALFFGVLAVLMLVNTVGFLSIRGHVPPLVRKGIAA